MLGLLAAREAAVIASGHGSLLNGQISASTIDGFAAGVLLSGLVLLVILAQRRARRRRVRAAGASALIGDMGRADSISPDSTHSYADVPPQGWISSRTDVNEVATQAGVRVEEWLEGEMRRPARPGWSRVGDADAVRDEAASEAVQEPGHPRRAVSYQSKHRLAGRNDSKPWPDDQRRVARHATASSGRSSATSRRLDVRQFGPVSAGD